MYTQEIESIEQADQLILQNVALLIYFFNDSCAPCLSLRPKVAELIAKSFPEIKLCFINSFKNSDIAAHFNSFSNPTLILFFDGKEHRRFSKYISISELKEEISLPYSILFE